jgi:hypothetical protein
VRWGRCGDLRGRGGQFIGPEEVRRGSELGNGRRRKLKGGGEELEAIIVIITEIKEW